MADYFLAPSLKDLRTELNMRWPGRDTKSDGWIGDAAHSARKSDHNPDWDAPGSRRGIVRALDIDKDGIDADLLLDILIGHEVVQYVIFNRKIYNRSIQNWLGRPYDGINAHKEHIHVSIRHTVAAEIWMGTWLPRQPPVILPPKPPVIPVEEDVKDLRIVDSIEIEDNRQFLVSGSGWKKHIPSPEARAELVALGIPTKDEKGNPYRAHLKTLEMFPDLD